MLIPVSAAISLPKYGSLEPPAVITTGIANEFNVDYMLDEIPEPPQSLFNNIIDTITGTVKGWLCSNFGVFC